MRRKNAKPLPLCSASGRYRYRLSCRMAGVPSEFELTTELPGLDLARWKFLRWVQWHREAGVPLGRVTNLNLEYREAA